MDIYPIPTKAFQRNARGKNRVRLCAHDHPTVEIFELVQRVWMIISFIRQTANYSDDQLQQ